MLLLVALCIEQAVFFNFVAWMTENFAIWIYFLEILASSQSPSLCWSHAHHRQVAA